MRFWGMVRPGECISREWHSRECSVYLSMTPLYPSPQPVILAVFQRKPLGNTKPHFVERWRRWTGPVAFCAPSKLAFPKEPRTRVFPQNRKVDAKKKGRSSSSPPHQLPSNKLSLSNALLIKMLFVAHSTIWRHDVGGGGQLLLTAWIPKWLDLSAESVPHASLTLGGQYFWYESETWGSIRNVRKVKLLVQKERLKRPSNRLLLFQWKLLTELSHFMFQNVVGTIFIKVLATLSRNHTCIDIVNDDENDFQDIHIINLN